MAAPLLLIDERADPHSSTAALDSPPMASATHCTVPGCTRGKPSRKYICAEHELVQSLRNGRGSMDSVDDVPTGVPLHNNPYGAPPVSELGYGADEPPSRVTSSTMPKPPHNAAISIMLRNNSAEASDILEEVRSPSSWFHDEILQTATGGFSKGNLIRGGVFGQHPRPS